MKRVRVLVPFTDRVTGETYEKDAEIQITDERVNEIKSFNVNLIEVLGEVKKSRKKQ